MAKGLGYEMAVVSASLKTTTSKRNEWIVSCPLCRGKMEFEAMADAWFCYSAETGRGVPYCPGFNSGPDYRDNLQGKILFTQSDSRCVTVRGRNGKTNIRVDGNPNPDEEWIAV